MTALKDILKRHGVTSTVQEYGDELLSARGGSVPPNTELIDRVKNVKAQADAKGETLVFKAFNFHFKGPEVAEYLRSIGTRVVMATEYNELDVVVCAVTDCMIQDPSMAYSINPKTREPYEGGCFRGRKGGEQEDIPMVWMNASSLLWAIGRGDSFNVKACEIADLIDACRKETYYYSSALLEHEYDFSEDALSKTSKRWARLVAQLGLIPNKSAVQEVLASYRTAEPRLYAKHDSRVVNLPDVANDLKGTDFTRFIRQSDCTTSTCSYEAVSPFKEATLKRGHRSRRGAK